MLSRYQYRIGIVTTHPIQYQVPWFQRLAEMPEIDLMVFFCQLPDVWHQGDGYGVAFSWDIPMLDGYHYEVLHNVARRPSLTSFFGCDTPEMFHHVCDGNFDAIVVNGWVVKSCLQALWACRRLGIPCLVRGDSNAIRRRAWWKQVIHRWLLKQYAACLYTGASNAEFYRQYGVKEDRLFPSLHFVDNKRFAAQAVLAGDRRGIRRRWGIAEDRVVYIFSGRFVAKKHPLELLDAFRMAVASRSNIHLIMVGDGELRAACESFVARHRLPVSFAGFLNQTELPAAYAAADCLILSSDSGETWGLVVNEAMACGVPVIVSDQVGCHADLVVPGTTGMVFRYGEWNSLAKLIAGYSEHPAELRRMGNNARSQIADYSPEAAALGTLEAVKFVTHPTSA